MKKFYRFIILFAIAGWIVETAYFGWNDKPINAQEKMADAVFQIMLIWGILGDILTNLHIQKHDHNVINTKTLNINGKPIIHLK